MRLVDTLQRRLAGEQSLFRAQLLREDLARLSRLETVARTTEDFDAFRKAALRIEWTPGNARTQELAAPLERFLAAFHAGLSAAPGSIEESAVERAWLELDRLRMERLLGCLATPVPKPE